VRRNEESTLVVFWKVDEPNANDDRDELHTNEKQRRRFVLRHYHLFNLEQCALLQRVTDKLPKIETHEKPILRAHFTNCFIRRVIGVGLATIPFLMVRCSAPQPTVLKSWFRRWELLTYVPKPESQPLSLRIKPRCDVRSHE
jgi:hypothetical protein